MIINKLNSKPLVAILPPISSNKNGVYDEDEMKILKNGGTFKIAVLNYQIDGIQLNHFVIITPSGDYIATIFPDDYDKDIIIKEED